MSDARTSARLGTAAGHDPSDARIKEKRSRCAPVGISAYARPGHLERAVAALLQNPHAEQTDVYFFSDAAQPGDEDAVASVRAFIHDLRGFKSISLITRDTNNRVFNNRDGMRQLLEQYGRFIWLEEDIVVAPGFLTFMNAAVDAYADNDRIFSICGYRPPFPLPAGYEQDAFLLPRFSAWGFATWKDRFDRIRLTIPRSEYYRFLLNPFKVARFTRGGWDMLPMLHAEVMGRIDALDVKIFYQQFLMGMNTVYPSRHLAANIGHDGTGLHCIDSDRFNVQLDESADCKFTLPPTITIDPEILKANQAFRDVRKLEKLRFPFRVLRDALHSRRQPGD